MADITSGIGSQRALALQKARAEAADDAKFGRQFSDRLGGGLAAALYGVGGGLTDLYSNAAGMFGQEDMAARMGMQSDEMYRRALANLEGKEAGLEASSSSQIGLTPGERSTIASRENNQIIASAINAGKFAQNVDAGGPYDAGVPYDVGFDPLLQTGKPNTTAIRKEGESKDDFRNRILNEQSVTSSYDFEGPQSLSSAQMLQQKINALTDVDASRAGLLDDPTTKLSQTTTGPSPEEVAMMEAARSEGQGAPAENAFMEALAEKNNAEGKEQPKAETRAELLEKYKQEFAEATGINIDGKPDNSQALMAMGLSLMQNRAGKGFNVGKMLSAVGEAGEKALPELSKAKSEAKAARVAAGKYALGQIKADEGVEAAIASSELAFEREKIIKEMELREKDKEQEWKGAEVKNPYSSEVMDGLSIRMGRSRTGAKYFDPSNALKKIAKTQRKVNGALETLDQMEVLLDDLGDANTGNAAKLIGDRIKTLMVAGGLTNAKVAFPETGISTEDELEAYQKSVVNEFKRFLTQETGNGISNVDVKQLEVLLGDVSVFTNPLTAKKRLSRIRRIFTGKRKSVAALRDNIMDPRYYGTEQEYLDNVDQFDTLLAGNTTYRFVDDESGVISVEDEE